MIKCACGCEKEIPLRTDGKQCRYWHGHGNAGKVDAICAQCGKVIRVQNWRVIRFRNVFCSRRCKDLNWVKWIIRPCVTCGNPVKFKPSRKAGRIFCDFDCFVKRPIRHKKVQVHCAYCGKGFLVFPCKARNQDWFYCDILCRAWHITGKNNPAFRNSGHKYKYGANWKRQRRLAYIRDSYTCRRCGIRPLTMRYLHAHHVIPFINFNGHFLTANRIDNLITLCLTCHKVIERTA